MARTWWLPLIILTVVSLAPLRPAVAGMSEYGETVTKIGFYERFALLPRNRAVEGLLAHNRREAQNFLLKRVKSHPKDYKAYYLLAYLYEYNDDHRRYGPGFDIAAGDRALSEVDSSKGRLCMESRESWLALPSVWPHG